MRHRTELWTMAAALCLTCRGWGASTCQVEGQGIRVEVDVSAQVYTWTFTNLYAAPVQRITIPQHHTYDYQVPRGWQVQADDDNLVAFTTDAEAAIHPGQSAAISARVTSLGAVLGTASVQVGSSEGLPEVSLGGVWAPRRQSWITLAPVPVTLAAMALMHLLVFKRGCGDGKVADRSLSGARGHAS